jgi:PadR family transcriptional regulator PadR
MSNGNPNTSNKNHDGVCGQLRKKFGDAVQRLSSRVFVGEFQMDVLRAIGALGRDAYGIEIRRRLQRTSGREVSTPQVYAALSRVTDLGLVTSDLDQSATAGRRGRPRRVYTLTTSGLRMLKAGNDLYNSMSRKGDNGAQATPKGQISP